ncbi:hypothetical protein [Paenibacillus sedimenti]|uniref:Uncharacterized protein n=1 Tax=Paenibacillus sedimenti TaxID=2770274 RepID=A0A926KNU7_9BACL|nr:hypothetical protein [Paenibacillus sedimenti]MBD0380181.1 hypothetical protein [Paenibacillus sedimenti]
MFYHALVKYSNDSQDLCTSNITKETLVDKLLIPFVNGHIVSAGNEGKIVNLKSAYSITIYNSDEKLVSEGEAKLIDKIKANEFQKNNCTKEILNEYKHKLHIHSKSDIQRKFSEIQDNVFVIMKFGDSILDSAYDGVIEPIVREFNLTPIRVDKLQDSGKITDQIIDNISSSKYVIADLSGERPNTYYEAGFAHALGKEVILTIKKGEHIHFDLSGHRFIQWETESDLRLKLKERFKSLTNNN